MNFQGGYARKFVGLGRQGSRRIKNCLWDSYLFHRYFYTYFGQYWIDAMP